MYLVHSSTGERRIFCVDFYTHGKQMRMESMIDQNNLIVDLTILTILKITKVISL